MNRRPASALCRLAIGVLAPLLVTGCLHDLRPGDDALLEQAQLRLAEAGRPQVAGYASTELGEARAQWQAAELALRSGQRSRGLQLAEQSMLSAQLVIVRAELARGELASERLRHSSAALRAGLAADRP